MSRVFIFGGTGFIGSGIAEEFISHGYKVFSLARSEEKEIQLEKNEITGIRADIQETSKWYPIASTCDIIIDASTFNHMDQLLVLEQIKKIKSHDNPNLFAIYTGGLWTFGEHDQVVNEHSKPCIPLGFEFINHRISIQNEYMKIGACVMSPGALYGMSGSYVAQLYFKPILEGKGTYTGYGDKDQWLVTVHRQDLARAYRLAAENPSVAKGQLFIVFSHQEKVIDIIQAAATNEQILLKGIHFLPPDQKDNYTIGLGLSYRADCSKIRNLLKWYPVMPSVVSDISRYMKSYKASNKKDSSKKQVPLSVPQN
ncbi:hypothetical protein DLAC_08050 [Tieghemostelium lacteum]|uniref:NAD-dependent epimerase/dehydratase domain-containing protein n=1 Tax=Tieghemostelium lacteum TaxID=361077 RepID=A0A151ZB30_TIELA|nr:hypothetical protein DLAC_08050 [Tieghemostelium lacteum]|eukprot:KYQ91141.1 hypothetical protein DLAC_08050 [Tieghemostelium lacteum]